MLKTIAIMLVGAVLAACVQSRDEPPAHYTPVPVAGPVATDAERAACTAAGGIIRPAGLAGNEFCVQTYPDAGAACSDNSACVGRCLVEGAILDDGTPVAGVCEGTDSPFGCTQEVDDGLAGLAICID